MEKRVGSGDIVVLCCVVLCYAMLCCVEHAALSTVLYCFAGVQVQYSIVSQYSTHNIEYKCKNGNGMKERNNRIFSTVRRCQSS